jgi:hypothetical protein
MRADRAALAREVLALRAEGLTHKEIGGRLGIHWKKSSILATDPDGSRLRESHERAGGVCVDCGGWTSQGNGTSPPSERCLRCEAARVKDTMKWTRASVVAAIQRFASAHGRPPIAAEWTRSDPINGYPPRTSVYRSTSGWQGAPFASWAAAIEAAGFERPTVGRRIRQMPSNSRNGYVVLRERDDGLWEVVGQQEEVSQSLALNKALNGHNPDEGRWVAVPGRYWDPRTLKPRTIYEFVTA